MNKEQFLKQLKKALDEYEFTRSEREEILEDYSMLINEAIERGEDETTFLEKLDSPKRIASSIRKVSKKESKSDSKIIALSPFIALIIFFYMGFAHNAWHPAWMAFLLIPITAITLEVKGLFEKLTALSVFIALISFMVLGTYLGLWHPMWALFLIVPALGFLNSHTLVTQLFGIYTFLAMIFFIGYTILIEPTHYYVFIALFPIPVMGLITGEISIVWNDEIKSLRALVLSVTATLLLVIVYVYIGLTYEIWHPTWLMFLLIPLGAMLYSRFILKERIEFVAFTPFIAVAIFFLWGEYYNAYAYSWLVFLMIPITAILFESEEKTIEVTKHDE